MYCGRTDETRSIIQELLAELCGFPSLSEDQGGGVRALPVLLQELQELREIKYFKFFLTTARTPSEYPQFSYDSHPRLIIQFSPSSHNFLWAMLAC